MPRAVLPGVPHHVTQRGIDRQPIFFADRDREVYLELLRVNARRHGLSVHGYCLMTNHVHLVAVPQRADSLAKGIRRMHFQYAAYANALLGRSGHFWQNRYFSCALEECHLWAALRYVERNPVRAGLVKEATEWRWSSARAHALGIPDPILSDDGWGQHLQPAEWAMALAAETADDAEVQLRTNTYTGRPVGSSEFVAAVEAALGRRLTPRKGGRPKAQPEDRQMVLLACPGQPPENRETGGPSPD